MDSKLENWIVAHRYLVHLEREKEKLEQELEDAKRKNDMKKITSLTNRIKILEDIILEAEEDEKEKWKEYWGEHS